MRLHNTRLKIFGLSAIVLFFLSACTSREYVRIPLENLDPQFRRHGDQIVTDIITSIGHEEGAQYLLHKSYITPMVHGRIMMNQEVYEGAYSMVPLFIGNITGYDLFEVVDKGLVKSMRYKLSADMPELDFVELKIDINQEDNLADFYLYVTNKKGRLQHENILPKFK